jgi:import inner membrane translocase subunit TIM8
MDALGGGLANVDISKLSDRDKQELQQFAMNEGQKARIQSCTCYTPIDTSFILIHALTNGLLAIHSLTDTCFRKCIPAGNVKNGKLDKYEEPCMRQCVDRFLDANLVVLRELERLRQ